MKQRFMDYSPSFWPLVIVMLLVSVLVGPANAAVFCNQTTSNLPLYPSISTPHDQAAILAAENVPDGSVLLTIGMSNTSQFSDPIVARSGGARITIVNGAQGGAAATQWAAAGSGAWNVAISRVPGGANNVSVVWIVLVDRVRTDLQTYIDQLTSNLNAVVVNARKKFPNLQLILISGLHHEVFAPLSSKQPEPFAHQSSVTAKSIAAANSDVTEGPYLWNAGATPRIDGFLISCDMINTAPTTGGVHLNGTGSNYIADQVVDVWFQNDPVGQALWGGSGNPPPDDPPSDTQVCEPTPPQDRCRVESGNICHCAFPETFVQLGDEPPPPDNPPPDDPPLGICEPTVSGQRCSDQFNAGFCTCINPWSKTPLVSQ